MKNRFIGDKNFYRHTLSIMLPIVIQNAVTQFVNLLDNIMVGQVGTQAMTGVSIANQLFFVYALCIFGAVSGAGIFGAQFAGRKDDEGIRYTFRFKFLIASVLTIIGILIFATASTPLISLFLRGKGDATDIAQSLVFGRQYLMILIIGLFPFAYVQVYSSTLRETGETNIPMKASVAAVLTNLVGNYILIFGKFGAPALGAAGAAIATSISRFVELAIVAIWTHRHSGSCKFIEGVYKSLRIPRDLFKGMIFKSAPTLANEALWSAGISMLLQCYSVYSYNVVAALNIAQTIANIFFTVTLAFGSAIAIIVGQILGTGNMEKAKDTNTKLTAFSLASSLVTGGLMALLAPLIAKAYNVTPEVRSLAVSFLLIIAAVQPIRAFCNCSYFTLRSGGKTLVTFLFDSVFVWTVCVTVAYYLTRKTGLHIIPIYIIVQLLDIIKGTIGFILVKKGVWLRNLVAKDEV